MGGRLLKLRLRAFFLGFFYIFIYDFVFFYKLGVEGYRRLLFFIVEENRGFKIIGERLF